MIRLLGFLAALLCAAPAWAQYLGPPVLGTGNGWTIYSNTALSNTAANIKTSGQGQISAIWCFNPSAAVAYVQIFNAPAASVTVGTTPPTAAFGLLNATAVTMNLGNPGLNVGGTGISIAATTTATGGSAPGTALVCTLGYN